MIKTHECYQEPYGHAVYLVRDPRAVVLSEHRFQTMHGFSNQDFDRFLEDFLEGRVHGLGAWNRHVQSWLDSPLGDRLLIVRFEELRADPQSVLASVLSHLGVRATVADISRAIERNTIENMRVKEDASELHKSRGDLRHVNSGQTAGWRDRLDSEQRALLDTRWEPLLERLGYPLTVASPAGETA